MRRPSTALASPSDGLAPYAPKGSNPVTRIVLTASVCHNRVSATLHQRRQPRQREGDRRRDDAQHEPRDDIARGGAEERGEEQRAHDGPAPRAGGGGAGERPGVASAADLG